MRNNSKARRLANRANARLSTGPRTPEGKAVSSQNARTHGLCAKDLIVAPHEQEEFQEMLQSHLAQLQPDNVIEQTLFDELVAATWNLRRIRRLEAELCRDIDPLAALDDDKLQNKLDRLARHQARFERSLYRATKELKALQTERSHRKLLDNAEYLATVSPFVSSVVLTNQTRIHSLAAVRQIRGEAQRPLPAAPDKPRNSPKRPPAASPFCASSSIASGHKNEYRRQLELAVQQINAEAKAEGLC